MTTTETEQSAFVAAAKADTLPFDPAGKDLVVVYGWADSEWKRIHDLTEWGWVVVPGSFHAVSLHRKHGGDFRPEGEYPYIFVQFWRVKKETP